jgi:transcriptional regulator NrdR family protein
VEKSAVQTDAVQRLGHMLDEVVEAVTRRSYAAADSYVISAPEIALFIADELKHLDPVSHIRFSLVQIGRLDHGNSEGWRDVNDVRRWLLKQYPSLETFRPNVVLSEVVKKDGRRVPFERKRLERSIGLAAKGRGISDAAVAQFARQVSDDVQEALGDQAIVTSGQLAAEILHVLRRRDHVAFLRYASTAKRYLSPEDYETEAVTLRNVAQQTVDDPTPPDSALAVLPPSQ